MDLVAVAGQREAVVQVGFGLVVLEVAGFDLGVEGCRPSVATLC